MKILQLTASYKPAYVYGGPTMSVSKLSEALSKASIDLEVITTTANGLSELPVQPGKQVNVDGVQVTYFRRLTKDHTHFSPFLFKYLLGKLNKLSKETPTSMPIVHIQAWWNLVSIFSCLIAKRKKIPVVLSPRGTLSNYSFGNRNSGIKDYIHRFLGKVLLQYCHFHVTSEKEKDDILGLVRPKSISVIPNFVKVPEEYKTAQESYLNEKPLRLLFISRVEEKKGLELLFDALKNVPFEWELSIAGTGSEDYLLKLKKVAATLGLTDRIFWLGHIGNDLKFDLMQRHHVMVLPSYDENFANVVIESLSVGTAVLVTENVGLSAYIKENNLGWVFERDLKSLEKMLVEVANAAVELASIRRHAPTLIRKDFDEKKLTDRYIKMYNTILKNEVL
ncbi:XrtY-associated glycosyltransferase XYAG1 [Desertivirga xinjiangensis]|uniref:XrtY-associated glycosyltransferase XYAG1 n=1 Tax=Desertivirga xinjiangensis TaxID=539206 RepID=UPI00210F1565